MALIIWAVFRRLKSWSLMNITAGGAVMDEIAFDETKGKSKKNVL